jgi:hypothetical protein
MLSRIPKQSTIAIGPHGTPHHFIRVEFEVRLVPDGKNDCIRPAKSLFQILFYTKLPWSGIFKNGEGQQ